MFKTDRLCHVCLLGAMGATCTISTVYGDVIRPVSAVSRDPVQFGDPINLIDGVIDFDSNVGIGDGISGEFARPYSIVFDLGMEYDLTAFQLWNNAGHIELDGEGINMFTLLFADADELPIDFYTDNAEDILSMQQFAISVNSVRWVELVIESNHAPTERNYAALYELAFLPAPGVLSMFIGAGVVGIRRHR